MTHPKSENAIGAERLPASLREPLGWFVAHVRKMAGPRALSLCVFGSVAADSFDPTRHLVHNCLVCDRIELETLRQLALERTRILKSRIAMPVVLTPDYIHASLDTFPLELLEIHQRHITLFGEDLFASLQFEDRFIRLQCERELKAMLFSMRQGLLVTGGDAKGLTAIEEGAADGIMRILRGLMWLKGSRAAHPASTVVTDLESLLGGQKLMGVRALLSVGGQRGWQEFCLLYDDLNALGKYADAM